jgi:hypothetical protein
MSFTDLTNNKKNMENFVGNVVSKSQSNINSKKQKGGTSFIGKDFNYSAAIRTPSELGMSPSGNMNALAADIAGLINYTEVLVSGTGRAIKGKLGNQYFLKTLAKCKLGGRDVDRYLYINNVPTGNIKMGGVSMTGGRSRMRGLVPGMMENIGKINPLAMFQAFSEGTPECIRCPKSVCPVTDGPSNMPISKSDYKEVKESFQNIRNNFIGNKDIIANYHKKNSELHSILKKITNNKIAVSYNAGLSLLCAYIVYRFLSKK